MISKKTLLNNELVREIVAIRVNTLWKMLALEQRGELPDVFEEGATAKYDNKGAIFIPGGLIHQDVDERPVQRSYYVEGISRDNVITPDLFREQVRIAMRFDNATLLYPDTIATSVNLDGGFFSRAARMIYNYKKAAFRRKKKMGGTTPLYADTDDILRSHCPPYFAAPYGARTRISTCVAMGLVEPAMFYAWCRAELSFCENQTDQFSQDFDIAQDPAVCDDGTVLYAPQIVVCHDTRYCANSYTGLTRFLGIGKFGEFATFTLEKVNVKLLRELKRKKLEPTDTDIFARAFGKQVIGIIRVYAATNLGKRSSKHTIYLVSPEKDLALDVKLLEEEARKQYKIDNLPVDPPDED